MIIRVELGKESYDITLERGALARAGEIIPLKRRVLVVTDSGVPSEYSDSVVSSVLSAGGSPVKVVIPEGEASKSQENLFMLLEKALEAGFDRKDAVVAVGGGVVGDLSGFAASIYMRGIDFYNIPTTLLSQVDSSVGGKTAIDFNGVKNVVGSFYQPKGVIIDPEVLKTLSKRQFASGLAEAVKMSLTSDRELFELIESEPIEKNIDTIIERSLKIKAYVVKNDAKENGLRKILNFGHTVGHGIEATLSPELYHGECVALGMLPMCSDRVKARLAVVLEKAGLPTSCRFDKEKALDAIKHDKKSSGEVIETVFVSEVGSSSFEKLTLSEIEDRIDQAF